MRVSPADSPAIDAITKKAMNGEDQMRTILKNISMSDPFLHKNPKWLTNIQAPYSRLPLSCQTACCLTFCHHHFTQLTPWNWKLHPFPAVNS